MSILCSLLDSVPLSVPQLSARLDRPENLVGFWVAMLELFDLVEWDQATAAYTATLDDQPEWVREAVRQSRFRVP